MRKIVALICFLCGWLLTPAIAQNSPAKGINQVIGNYLAVKDALAGGDGNLALSHARELLAEGWRGSDDSGAGGCVAIFVDLVLATCELCNVKPLFCKRISESFSTFGRTSLNKDFKLR